MKVVVNFLNIMQTLYVLKSYDVLFQTISSSTIFPENKLVLFCYIAENNYYLYNIKFLHNLHWITF